MLRINKSIVTVKKKKKRMEQAVNSIYLPGTITFSHLAVKK